MVSLSQSQYLVVESNESLIATITLNNAASEDLTVEVALSDGSAIGNISKMYIGANIKYICLYVHLAGIDYATTTSLVFNVTLSAGMTSLSFSVDISDDKIQEPNETFYVALRLLPSCLPLKLGISRSTVIIINTEGMYICSYII